MGPYPGIAPLAVAVSGASPGILVTSGSGDAYGWWPTPLVVNGNDARNAANLMAANEALTDRTNFLGQHMIDWVRGGTWATWTPGVAWGGHLSIDHSTTADSATGLAARGGSVNGGGVNGLGGGGNAYGVKGQGTGTVAGLWGVGDPASSGPGLTSTGGATGNGAVVTGGATGGNGIVATAAAGNNVGVVGSGHGTGAGVFGIAGGTAGTPGVTSSSGPMHVDTNIASNTTNPGKNAMWADVIPKSVGVGHSAAGVIVVDGGINWTAVISGGTQVVVSFVEPMANADYDVSVTVFGGGGALFAANPIGTNGPGTFTFQAAPLNPGAGVGALCDFSSTSFGFSFRVFGKQT